MMMPILTFSVIVTPWNVLITLEATLNARQRNASVQQRQRRRGLKTAKMGRCASKRHLLL
jgi:hypothetical protein